MILTSLPRDAMHKRGLCRNAVSVCPSGVCNVGVLCRNEWSLNISSNFFYRRVTKLFPYQTLWEYYDWNPLMGASKAGGYKKSRFTTNTLLYLGNDTR